MDKSKNCSKILLDKGPDFGNVNDIYFAFNSNSAFVPLQGRSFEMATEFKNKHILKRDDILDTPLHVAVMFGTNNEVLEILKDPKAHRYLNMQDRNGNTPLHLAVMESYFIVYEFLEQKNINVNIRNNDGNTPLHLAATEPYNLVVHKILKQKNINVNIRNNRGNTPLQVAAIYYITTLANGKPSLVIKIFELIKEHLWADCKG